MRGSVTQHSNDPPAQGRLWWHLRSGRGLAVHGQRPRWLARLGGADGRLQYRSESESPPAVSPAPPGGRLRNGRGRPAPARRGACW